MTKAEKIHARIHARFQLRAVSANHYTVRLVNDNTRKVYTLEIEGVPFRAAWFQAIYDALESGKTPEPARENYREWAR